MDYRSPAAENHSRKGRTDRTTAVSLPGNYAAIVTKVPHPQGPGTWPMTKEIRLNAFDMNCVGHIQHGHVGSPARSLDRVQHDRILAVFGGPSYDGRVPEPL